MPSRREVEASQFQQLAAAAIDGVNVDWPAASVAATGTPHAGLIRELSVIATLGNPSGSDTVGADSGVMTSAETAPSTRLDIGSRALLSWGPLQILRLVGQGSFGRVFQARDTRLDRQVALKLFDRVPNDVARRVVPEARLLAQVRHENVVTVYGADDFEPAAGIWMEFVNGRTLRQLCSEQDPLSASEALIVGLDVCRALAAVHRAGFVHGDIKAQNVMRQAGGRIVLTDFGAARLIALVPTRTPITATPYYAAPELLLGAQASVRTDLYSLGVLLYFLVTGNFPVTGRTPGDLVLAHVQGSLTRLRDRRPDLPSSFIHAVDIATARLPEDRPDSAGALEALLARATGRVGIVAVGRPDISDGTGDRSSIAVLPFTDRSRDASLGHFCEGLADELITTLIGISGLRVAPRSSAFTVPPNRTSKRAGAALNVRTVLRGSVSTSGRHLRVTARLDDAITGAMLWSRRFERSQSNLLGLQQEIAAAASSALGVQQRHRTEPIAGGAARNPEAYTLYLKGRYCWNQRTEITLQKSVTYFQAAIDKDPDFGPAHAALAESITTIGLYGMLAPHDIMPRARAAARRAIELAGDRSSAHATAACIAAVYDWDWPNAARAYHRALEITPNESSAHHWYAINYLVPLRRFDEAAVELQRAVDVEPLSMPIRATVGLRSYFAHDFGRAERELRECLDVDRGSATARLFLGLTLVEAGRGDEAIHELETAIEVAGSPETIAALAYACAAAGQSERARRLRGELVLLSQQRYVSPSLVAQVHAGLGETDEAIAWLVRAVDAHAADVAWLGVRPVFDGLRADPRFDALLARVQP